MIKNKKGNFSDVLSWIEVSFILVLVGGMVLLFVNNWDSNVQGMDPAIIPAQVKATSTELNDYLPKALDYIFLAMYLVFLGFSVMSARLIPSTPKFIFITIIALIFFTLGGMLAENIWVGWFENVSLNSIFTQMTFLPFIMNNLRYFVLFYSVAVGVSLLSKENA